MTVRAPAAFSASRMTSRAYGSASGPATSVTVGVTRANAPWKRMLWGLGHTAGWTAPALLGVTADAPVLGAGRAGAAASAGAWPNQPPTTVATIAAADVLRSNVPPEAICVPVPPSSVRRANHPRPARVNAVPELSTGRAGGSGGRR